MNKTKTIVKTNFQDTAHMQKYIVEVNAPQNGQKVSTGGLRENGKMAAQFTNPIPYIEPIHPLISQSKSNEFKEYAKNCVTELAQDAMYDGLKILWFEFFKPLLRSKLHQLRDKTIASMESQKNISKTNLIIPAEPPNGELNTASSYEYDNIVPFSNGHVS